MDILATLFGADRTPGGVPGAVGKVADAGILNTVLGGVGKVIAPVGNTAVAGLGDWVADVVTKNPLEILKNPASVLNDRGEPSWTRLLFPDFRRNDIAAKKQAAEIRDIELKAKGIGFVKDVAANFFGPNSGMSPAEGAQKAIAAGVPEEDARRMQQKDYAAGQEAQGARQTAQALGYPEQVVGSVTQDDLPSMYNTAVDNQRAAETAAEARARATRGEGRAERRLSLAEKAAARAASGIATPGKTTGAERQGQADVKMLKRLLRKGQITDDLRPEAKEAVRAKSGRQAYNILSQTIGTQRTSSPSQIMANPAFREASDRARAAQAAQAGVAASVQAAMTPDGKGIDPTLFSPAMAALLPDSAWGQSVALGLLDEERGKRKQNLISTNAKNLGDYVLRMTGKVSNVNELERLKTVAPTGNEASGVLYQTKVGAFDRALQREAEIAAREAEAIGSGMQSGDWRSTLYTSEYESNLRQLNEDLAEIEQDADNQSDAPLTPEEQAELEKYRGNR